MRKHGDDHPTKKKRKKTSSFRGEVGFDRVGCRQITVDMITAAASSALSSSLI